MQTEYFTRNCLTFRENNIATYFIVPTSNRRKPHLFNTLNVRSNMMTGGRNKYCYYNSSQSLIFYARSGGKRKPSFKMVSNMFIQLLHTIKFSMEVPFSNMTQQPEMQKTLTTKKVNFLILINKSLIIFLLI